jgi:hypothetical protein
MSLEQVHQAEQPRIAWHGSSAELAELANVLRRNCRCPSIVGDEQMCAAHSVLESQRALDGLLFGRFMAAQWARQEFTADLDTTAEVRLREVARTALWLAEFG